MLFHHSKRTAHTTNHKLDRISTAATVCRRTARPEALVVGLVAVAVAAADRLRRRLGVAVFILAQLARVVVLLGVALVVELERVARAADRRLRRGRRRGGRSRGRLSPATGSPCPRALASAPWSTRRWQTDTYSSSGE